ncbi:hypothetical protein TRP8649_01322 [Pelagimonas phthalicica]|uniref:Uncharacterized protein n=1 Tax=Pelagimonas phthalicica TaxID=1037362 RepID=A0A238J931_9RHOB|nr:hypothetical protein [Pelagimonas phthalicica]TDS94253.1 hypothetical protein CLV87_0750 [Pelagimonas phthalicica]SMX27220.1 hypothetical protein TRP8649_01322 [Pelagimonas phthalicica]
MITMVMRLHNLIETGWIKSCHRDVIHHLAGVGIEQVGFSDASTKQNKFKHYDTKEDSAPRS